MPTPAPFPGLDDDAAYAAALVAQRKAVRRRRQRAARRRRAGTDPCAVHHPRGAAAKGPRTEAQRVGAQAEAQALALLRQAGLVLLARNLSCRAGEIDLVMRDGDVLVFVEVRARSSARYGGAAASVRRPKQRRLQRTAAHFLPALARRYWAGSTPRCRFDVVALEAAGPAWLRDAFGGD